MSVKWVIGWFDGIDVKLIVSIEGDDFVLLLVCIWFIFEGYVSDFFFDFVSNMLVVIQVIIQCFGVGKWMLKLV